MRSSRGHRQRSRRLQNDINVVPYIDVMLVLLVIFMVTAPMITPGLIDLPSVGRADSVPSKPIEVQIAEGGTLSLRVRDSGAEFQEVSDQHLIEEVHSRLTPETPVVIAADGKVPYETVMQVMDKLRSSGITRLGLLVDQQNTSETKQASR